MYRLYLDETGNADLRAADDPNHRYLSLCGVIIHHDHVRRVVTPRLNKLKADVFPFSDPDEPAIVLHRRDIMQGNPPFHVLLDPNLRARFDAGLLSLLDESEYTVLTAVVDKLDLRERYRVWRHNPYHYCMEAVVERYVHWLRDHGVVGDVMVEQRGGRVDRLLEASFARHYARGTAFVRRDVMQQHLTSKKLKIRPKRDNITGLQVADLLAHPSAQYIRSTIRGDVQPIGFGQQIAGLLVNKKYRRGYWNNRIAGYGTKWLP